jgi:hypothetical protein
MAVSARQRKSALDAAGATISGDLPVCHTLVIVFGQASSWRVYVDVTGETRQASHMLSKFWISIEIATPSAPAIIVTRDKLTHRASPLKFWPLLQVPMMEISRRTRIVSTAPSGIPIPRFAAPAHFKMTNSPASLAKMSEGTYAHQKDTARDYLPDHKRSSLFSNGARSCPAAPPRRIAVAK